MSDSKDESSLIVCGGDPPPEAESLPGVCPKCGADTIFGYGMAFGGIGSYVVCGEGPVACDFVAKQQDKDA